MSGSHCGELAKNLHRSEHRLGRDQASPAPAATGSCHSTRQTPVLGIVAKVLTDGGYLKQPVGLQIFTVVIIAELIAAADRLQHRRTRPPGPLARQLHRRLHRRVRVPPRGSLMPVVERDSERFLGAVTSNDIIQLVTMETTDESRSPHRPVKTSTRS